MPNPVEYAKRYMRRIHAEVPLALSVIRDVPRLKRIDRKAKAGIPVPVYIKGVSEISRKLEDSFEYVLHMFARLVLHHEGRLSPEFGPISEAQHEKAGRYRELYWAMKGFEERSPEGIDSLSADTLMKHLAISIERIKALIDRKWREPLELNQKQGPGYDTIYDFKEFILADIAHMNILDKKPSSRFEFNDYLDTDKIGPNSQGVDVLKAKIEGVLLGLGYHPGDIPSIRDRILRCLVHNELRCFYSELNQKDMKKNMNLNAIADKMADRLRELGIEPSDKNILHVLEGVSKGIDRVLERGIPPELTNVFEIFRSPTGRESRREFTREAVRELKEKVKTYFGTSPVNGRELQPITDPEFHELRKKTEELRKAARDTLRKLPA